MVTELVQVCFESINSDVEQREIKALFEASEELKVNKLTVLTWDEKREDEKDGLTISFKPLHEWLLEIDKEINHYEYQKSCKIKKRNSTLWFMWQ